MTLKVATRSWLVDDAYLALKAAILGNDYPPGHQLSAQELALRLGMSRTPVQEAALRLQQEGLLDILPKRGIRIRALSAADIAEIYDVIIAIEGHAAEINASKEDAERHAIADTLEEATARMDDALLRQDMTAWGDADAAFHQLLVAQTGNQRFVQIIATVNAQAHRARMLTVTLRENLPRSIEEHRAMAQAIRAGQPGHAHTLARAHRARARGELIPLIERLGLKHL